MTGIVYSILFYSLMMHPVHISSTNIEYNESKKSFIISIKLNVEDFEAALFKKYERNIKISESSANNDTEKCINSYILDNFALMTNNKDQTFSKLKFINTSSNVGEMWLNYEFKFKGKLKSVKVKNSILHDLYQDQTNLLIFTYKDIQNAYKLRYNENVVNIDLKN